LKIDQFLVEVRMISPLAKGEQMAEVENIVRFRGDAADDGRPGKASSSSRSRWTSRLRQAVSAIS
jgi:hypothetical protein